MEENQGTEDDRWLTRTEAARIARCTVRTIDRWAEWGLLKKHENRRGQVRISLAELDQVLSF